MAIIHIIPGMQVRNAGAAAKRREPKIPSLTHRGRYSRHSAAVVAGVKFDLQRNSIVNVAREWGIDETVVRAWADGRTRLQIKPAEWPASTPKKQA